MRSGYLNVYQRALKAKAAKKWREEELSLRNCIYLHESSLCSRKEWVKQDIWKKRERESTRKSNLTLLKERKNPINASHYGI